MVKIARVKERTERGKERIKMKTKKKKRKVKKREGRDQEVWAVHGRKPTVHR